MRTSKLLLSDIGLLTGVSLDKSPGDSLLFKQSALRGVSYALTVVRTFKLSNDPKFEEKFWDVIGLYLDPPAKVLVLCCDEKSQCQALERTQLSPKRPAR